MKEYECAICGEIATKGDIEFPLCEYHYSKFKKVREQKKYYRHLFAKYLPEVKAIEKGRIRVLKDEEIDEFLAD